MESTRVLECLTLVEEAAEDVLTNKQQYFSSMELETLTTAYAEYEMIFRKKSNTIAAAKEREQAERIVDLDLKRNMNREALRALRTSSDSEKVMVCFGNMFIKFPKSKTQNMIQKDQEQLDKEINDLRKDLKAKVNHLNLIQGKPELSGYSLAPLSSDEVKAINHLMKR